MEFNLKVQQRTNSRREYISRNIIYITLATLELLHKERKGTIRHIVQSDILDNPGIATHEIQSKCITQDTHTLQRKL